MRWCHLTPIERGKRCQLRANEGTKGVTKPSRIFRVARGTRFSSTSCDTGAIGGRNRKRRGKQKEGKNWRKKTRLRVEKKEVESK